MANKPITPKEMKAYVDATWEQCQAEAWQEPEPIAWQGLTDEEIVRRKKVKPILVRIMQEAYDLADRDDSEGYNSVKVMCSDVLGMINKLLDERQWQGLTDEDREDILQWVEWKEIGSQPVAPQKLIAYVERKLREKNT